MEAKDEILAEEIRTKIDELNHLIHESIRDRGLRVDMEINEFFIAGYRERLTQIDCRIYKEVL